MITIRVLDVPNPLSFAADASFDEELNDLQVICLRFNGDPLTHTVDIGLEDEDTHAILPIMDYVHGKGLRAEVLGNSAC